MRSGTHFFSVLLALTMATTMTVLGVIPANANEPRVSSSPSDSIKTIGSTELISSDFNKLLDKASMIYTHPNGFVNVPVITNRDVSYDHAIKAQYAKLEIRYAILPLGEML